MNFPLQLTRRIEQKAILTALTEAGFKRVGYSLAAGYPAEGWADGNGALLILTAPESEDLVFHRNNGPIHAEFRGRESIEDILPGQVKALVAA